MRLIRTLSDKGQILIPKDIREIMVLKGGTEVKLNLENSKIIIKIKKESGGYSERFFKCAYKNTKS